MGTAVACNSPSTERADERPSHAADVVLDPGVRTLRNEILFQPGDVRQPYLIEAGVFMQYQRPPGRAAEIIEFAFAGDVIGFGAFGHHTCWAEAVGSARVRCVPPEELDGLLRRSRRAQERYAYALERDCEARRQALNRADRPALQRVAALFVALSALNRYEGRDPEVIVDTLECGAVAAWLRMDVASLGRALVELEGAGFIRRDPPHGVRLADLPALERLADEPPPLRH